MKVVNIIFLCEGPYKRVPYYDIYKKITEFKSNLRMKKIIYIILFIAFPQFIEGQQYEKTIFKYDQLGELKSVKFSQNDNTVICPKSATEFFKNILKKKDSDNYKEITTVKLEKGNEAFNQYYNGVKVDGAGYVLHYDDKGNMTYAHGNYKNISDIEVIPSISKEEAINFLIKN